MNEAVNPAPMGAEMVREAVARLEAACRREGIEENGPLGEFVRSQKEVIEQLAGIVTFAETNILAKVGSICESMDETKAKWETVEREKIKRLFEGGHKALDMAMEAAKAAAAAESLSAANRDLAVTRMAKTMSENWSAKRKNGWC